MPTYNPNEFPLTVNTQFISDQKTILGPLTTNIQSAWWGLEESGFVLHTFRIPDEAPVDKNIQSEIKVLSTSEGYCKQQQAIKIYIQKHHEY